MVKLKKIILAILLILNLPNLSSAYEGYYQNVNAMIEFKILAPENADNEIMEIATIDGNLKKIQKRNLIVSSDILGIFIDREEITFYFDRASWTKIRGFSSRRSNPKIALIKSNRIISILPMDLNIDCIAMLTMPEQLDINWFLEGFTKKPFPKNLYSEETYIQFLRDWVNEHPNDISALWAIVHYYVPETNFSNFENNFSGCDVGVPYLEKILIDTPTDLVAGNKLIMCFLKSKNYEHALKTAENLLSNFQSDLMKWPVVGAIGEIYYQSGRLKEAIQQIEMALKMCKESKVSSMENWENYSTELKEQAKKQYKFGQKEAIRIYEESIKRYKKELKEQNYRKLEM